ncbi:putative dehydrogenase [Kineococcus xinjiangensis]|uniref:Putative dehydrogenase n=1 Tax=Kineococcus xinjiangensis TaxID=512762 RepID=A0A2S6IJZ9_9ACTN|nr:Gfo/Idh/MocA family oxidoreductase [Kineococcus xinjiangensis]PPK94506.1 putative dehydrogenase [Kineococcus xinjiangensis]
MRVAVVGCGYWGAKHVRVLSNLPQVEQVVAVDPDRIRTAELQRSHPDLVTRGTVREAAPLFDAAVVATPPGSHAAVAGGLLNAGKHVLVEKPMATRVVDAERLITLAAGHGLTLMVGHTFEYNPAVAVLREAVRTGHLGRIRHIETARLNLGLFQRDVNVLWDLAPHDLSILGFLLGEQPDSVQAWGRPHVHPVLEDVVHLNLHYPTADVTAHVHVSWLDPCKVRRVSVVGTRRMAVYDDLLEEGRVQFHDKSATSVDPRGAEPVVYRDAGVDVPAVDWREPLEAEVAHFLECCATGRAPRSGGSSGLAVIRVLAAAERSLRRGAAVELREMAPAA